MSASERIHQLARAIGRFRDPGDPLRHRLCDETPHMSAEVMAAGLDASLAAWDEAGIAALWSEEQPYIAAGTRPTLAAVVLGGVLPPSHIQAIAYPFLLGAELIVKHPSADPLFPRLFAAALQGERITVVGRLGLGGVLQRADAVVVVGDDETVRTVAADVSVSTPLLGFGHQTAACIVLGSAVARSEHTAADIARDVTLFDQLGCLSPREILVVGGAGDAAALATNLAAQMEGLAPRAPLGVPIEAAIRAQRESAFAEGAPVHGPDDLQWTVLALSGGAWEGTPGGRTVVVRSIERLSTLPDVLAPLRGHLSAVAVAGGQLDPVTEHALIRFGASRIVPAGQLQCAPPTWPHDGHRPLGALCRWCGRV